jgi:hypothetical protein
MLAPSHGADYVSAVGGMSGHVAAIVYAVAAFGRLSADRGGLILVPTLQQMAGDLPKQSHPPTLGG